MPLTGEYEPSTSGWVRKQVEEYERSGGTEANTLAGTKMPIIILWTLGRSSGKVRKSGLMRVEHDGEYALVGSQGGAPTDPSWVVNLRAAPDAAAIQDGPAPFDVRVRELDGEERDLWWERSVAAFPQYAKYQVKTDRLIPVFLAARTTPPRGASEGT